MIGGIAPAKVIQGPSAHVFGATAITIVNVGGPGDLTSGDGIKVVDAANGATTELGWVPLYSSVRALLELFDGLEEGAGAATLPLAPQDVLKSGARV